MHNWRGRKLAAITAVSGLALLGVTACGEASDSGFTACMVTDEGGLDDQSFNQSAWNGMKGAQEKESEITIKSQESADANDYSKNIQNCLKDQKADLVVAVGGLIAEDLTQVAEENPDKRFAIVDANLSDAKNNNIYSMEFNAAQPSFLAGYLAAGMTKTGTVGTFGGKPIPPVTIFMDGYVEGVEYYNEQKDEDVKVLGWDVEKQDGTFTDNFSDQKKGKERAQGLVSEGADIIFPVGGPSGLGAPEVTEESDDLFSIWVDIDGCESTKYCDEFLTTSEKNIADAVTNAVMTAFEDGAKDGRSLGTLENEGVSLADYNAAVEDEELIAEIEEVKAGIIDGSIVIKSQAQPAPLEK